MNPCQGDDIGFQMKMDLLEFLNFEVNKISCFPDRKVGLGAVRIDLEEAYSPVVLRKLRYSLAGSYPVLSCSIVPKRSRIFSPFLIVIWLFDP